MRQEGGVGLFLMMRQSRGNGIMGPSLHSWEEAFDVSLCKYICKTIANTFNKSSIQKIIECLSCEAVLKSEQYLVLIKKIE